MTSTDSTVEQLEGIEEAQSASRKARPSIKEGGEWEGSKMRPKAREIETTKKSEDRARKARYDVEE